MKNGIHVNERGYKFWYLNGLCHREDGSAIEWADGDKWWWLNDRKYLFEEWLNELDVSEEDKLALKLTWT